MRTILPTSGMTRPVSLCPDTMGGTKNATRFPNKLKNVSWERGRGTGVLYQKSCRSLFGLVEKFVGNNTDCDFTVVTEASGNKTLMNEFDWSVLFLRDGLSYIYFQSQFTKSLPFPKSHSVCFWDVCVSVGLLVNYRHRYSPNRQRSCLARTCLFGACRLHVNNKH